MLCYEPQPNGNIQCDRVAGHGGKHTWELTAEIRKNRAAIEALRVFADAAYATLPPVAPASSVGVS